VDKEPLIMATNLALDDKLILEAVKAGGHRTKRDAVQAALKEYVQRRKQMDILGAFGQVDFDKDYDHKALRNRHQK
jgi:Arc/MetJ family transcription regulator